MRISLPSESATKTPSLMASRMERRTSVWRALSAVNSARRAFCVLSRRSFSRSACSFCLSSVTSVFVPNQRTTRPSASRMGRARERNHRYSPSLPRKGKVSSHGSPVAKARWMRSTTRPTSSG